MGGKKQGNAASSTNRSGSNKWFWGFAVLALAVILGKQLLAPSSPRRSQQEKKAKGSSLSHNLQNLQLLEQTSDQVSQLIAEGKLTEQDTKEYSEVIDLLEADIVGDDDIAKQIRASASVVRAQLLAAGKGMSDAEVEAKYNVSTYSSPRFWEEHYKSGPESNLDWYVEWGRALSDGSRVKDLITEYVQPQHKILVLGCGNSPLSSEMYKDGFRSQHNIDVSSSVIEQMKKRHSSDMQDAVWEAMDARQLSFADGHFDAIVDKGTFDAVSTDDAASAKILAETERVIRSGGSLISIGSKRLALLENSAGLSCGVTELVDAAGAGGKKSEASFMHRCRRE